MDTNVLKLVRKTEKKRAMSCSNPWRCSLASSPSPPRVHSIKSRSLLPNQLRIPNKTLDLPSLLQYGALLATIAAPAAKAVTGDNNGEEDLVTTLVTGGIAAALYLFVFPPVIMNWLRLRSLKRGFLEMYFQFMFVFMFFPGLMLWAPFFNFRPFPRDPTMKYPWSTPKDDTPQYKSR